MEWTEFRAPDYTYYKISIIKLYREDRVSVWRGIGEENLKIRI